MTRWTPTKEWVEERPEPKVDRYEAVTNLPAEGTRISATLTGETEPWVIHGKVVAAVKRYGGMLRVEMPVWIDHHYRGTQTIQLDLKLPWVIEIEGEQ